MAISVVVLVVEQAEEEMVMMAVVEPRAEVVEWVAEPSRQIVLRHATRHLMATCYSVHAANFVSRWPEATHTTTATVTVTTIASMKIPSYRQALSLCRRSLIWRPMTKSSIRRVVEPHHQLTAVRVERGVALRRAGSNP